MGIVPQAGGNVRSIILENNLPFSIYSNSVHVCVTHQNYVHEL